MFQTHKTYPAAGRKRVARFFDYGCVFRYHLQSERADDGIHPFGKDELDDIGLNERDIIDPFLGSGFSSPSQHILRQIDDRDFT